MRGLTANQRQKRDFTPVRLTGHPLVCVASSASVGISATSGLGRRQRPEVEEGEAPRHTHGVSQSGLSGDVALQTHTPISPLVVFSVTPQLTITPNTVLEGGKLWTLKNYGPCPRALKFNALKCVGSPAPDEC